MKTDPRARSFVVGILAALVGLASLTFAPKVASADEGLWPGETRTEFLHRPQLILAGDIFQHGVAFRVGGRYRWVELTVGIDLLPDMTQEFGGLKLFAHPDRGGSAYVYGRTGSWTGETSFSEDDQGRFGAFGIGIDISPFTFWHGFIFFEAGASLRSSDLDHANPVFDVELRSGAGFRL